MARRGLGKGLDVLIGSAAAMEGQRLEEIAVKDIRPNPRQPRRTFDEGALAEMAQSIKSFGVVQPVIVRPVGTEYELVAGERRWRAARAAGLEKIPAVIRDSSETDALEVALIENLHRSDLNGIEEATAYQQLLDDFGLTHEELSGRLGKSRAAITNTVRLLQLPFSIQKAVVDGRISTGHARALLALQDRPDLQETLAERIAKEGLSVRQTEMLIRTGVGHEKPDARREGARVPEEVIELTNRLADILDARVRGSVGKKKGRVVIEFRGMEDLRRIFEIIRRSAGGEAAAAETERAAADDPEA